MTFKFERKIRKLTPDTVGITFPKPCLAAIPWLIVGENIIMEIKEDSETDEITIVLKKIDQDD